ncbi:hypothetical protein D9758_008243 [Tetrapyrgos nigripes]|uniref:TPR-like protein n=1 Tax=Tetrapyrgos nigripes TaxID=182062 RepID=A0A8H5G1E6_9AGAR|nr:hypothetical protein D9758_008243 [Tetrapyrgos nigripes]
MPDDEQGENEEGRQICTNIQIGPLEPAEGFSSFAGYWSHRLRNQRSSIFQNYRHKYWGIRGQHQDRKEYYNRKTEHHLAKLQEEDIEMDIDEPLNYSEQESGFSRSSGPRQFEAADCIQEDTSALNLGLAHKESSITNEAAISSQWFTNAHSWVLQNSTFNNYAGTSLGVDKSQKITFDAIHFATPPIPKIFTGRDELVNEGANILCRNGQNHLAILGPGGIGKTSLALKISIQHEVQQRFHKCHFLPCDILEDHNGLIQGLMKVLGLQMQEGKGQHDILYSYLQVNQNPLLVILDNFETPWYYKDARIQAKHFIEKIAGFNCVTFIVTMRGMEGPGDIAWKILGESQIPTLSREAAREAFYQISRKIKTEDNSEKINHLTEQLDCVPLAIKLIAQLAKKIGIEGLSKMWKESKTKVLLEPGTQPGKLTSVEYSIELSVKLLDDSTKGLLRALSHLPNGVPHWKQILNNMLPDVPELELKVFQLLDCSLVLDKSDALMMLAPVREYICARYSISDFFCNQIEVFYVAMTEMISRDAKPDADVELHTLNLFKMLSQYQGQGGQEKAAHCLHWMGYMYSCQGKYTNAAKFLTEARVKFQNINNEYQAVNCLWSIGNVHRMQSRNNEAITMLSEAKTQFQKMDSKRGIADCLWGLGDIYNVQSEYNKARETLSEASVLYQSIGDQNGTANCLGVLGDSYRLQSKYSQATETLLEARVLYHSIGSQLGTARCLWGLCDIYRMQSKYNEAAETLSEANLLYQSIGNQVGTAHCLRSLGDIYRMQSKYSEATETLLEARVLYKSIGSQLGTAHCLWSLGVIYRMQSKYSEAVATLSEAKVMYQSVGEQRGIADCLRVLGQILCSQDQLDEAISLILEAYEIFSNINVIAEMGRCLQESGIIYTKMGQYELAKQAFINALGSYSQLQSPDHYGMGWCHYKFGLLFKDMGEFTEARKKFQEARDVFASHGELQGYVEMCEKALKEMESQ